jgi:hypothetical protein
MVKGTEAQHIRMLDMMMRQDMVLLNTTLNDLPDLAIRVDAAVVHDDHTVWLRERTEL